jgi:hypothetical protein
MTAVKPAARQLPLRVDSSQSSRVPSVRFGASARAPRFRGVAGVERHRQGDGVGQFY